MANRFSFTGGRLINTSSPKYPGPVKVFPIDLLFTAACTAQRINKDYVKSTQVTFVDDKHDIKTDSQTVTTKVVVESNLSILRKIVTGEPEYVAKVLPVDKEKAEVIKAFWQLKVFDVLRDDNCSPFIKSAVGVASRTELKSTDHKELGLIASLPSSYERTSRTDKDQEEIRVLAESSTHFGCVGQTVTGHCRVLKCWFNKTYSIYFVTGLLDGNLVTFATKTSHAIGTVYNIRGKIKCHYERDTTTSLNYVKILSTVN
jgi:hypothetical protein